MGTYIGEFAALGTALCWGVNSLLFTAAAKRIGSDAVAHLRLWIALFFLIFIHVIVVGSFFPMNISFEKFGILAVSGVIGFVLGDIFLFRSYLILGTSRALMIKSLAPSLAAIFSWFFLAESLKPIQIAAMVVIFFGIIIVLKARNGTTRDTVILSDNFFMGVVYAFIGAIGQAIGSTFSRMGVADGFSPLSATLVRIVIAAPALLLVQCVRSEVKKDFKGLQDKKAMRFLVSGSLLGSVFGVWLSLFALQHTKVGIASTLIELSPIVAMIGSSIIMKRKFHWLEWCGAGITFVGASLFFL